MKIKKDDTVIVLTGKFKGKTGTVTKANPGNKTLIVSGVNLAKRHMKPGMGSAGGIIEKELPIHVSNVAYYDEQSESKIKIGYSFDDSGKKVRVKRPSGEVIEG